MAEPSWSNFSRSLRLLTGEQRTALRRLDEGCAIDEMPVGALELFTRYGLVWLSGEGYELTADGRMVVLFC